MSTQTAILEMQPGRSFYRISSRADLPQRMWGIYTFTEAYTLCCEWNRCHDAAIMAWPEPIAWRL